MFDRLKRIFKKVDKYEYLKQQQKDLRTEIERNNNKTNAQIDKLKLKISVIKHQNNVFIKERNDKLTDINALLKNEQERILKDAEGEE